MRARTALSLSAVFAAGCVSRRAPPGEVARVRYGADRAEIAYAGRAPREKAVLLARINADRAVTGAPPVVWDRVAEKAGDAFCLDAARTGVLGHWDLRGRAPYDRYADAGGVDFHGENFSGTVRTGVPFRTEDLEGLLLEAHARMMAERPPEDGHRRTILDPAWTHVGIGLALEGGDFRMTEEFSRHSALWVEIPAGPVNASARAAPFGVGLPKGWNLAALEIAHERFPQPISVEEIRRRAAYAYPPATDKLLARLPANFRYRDGSSGDLVVSGGVVHAWVPLLSGRGSYWIFVYAAPGSIEGRPLQPLTAARIVAE